MPRHCVTRKLWNRKYMYKVTFYSTINRIFSSRFGKHKGVEYAKECVAILDECIEQNGPMQLPRYRGNYDYVSMIEYKYVKSLLELIENTDSIRTRVEYSTLNVYLEREEDLDRFINNKVVKKFIHEIWQPDPKDIQHLLSNENIFILKEPSPYQFRVYLKSGKHTELAKWLEANKDKTKATDYALMNMKESNWSSVYFYVRDEKLLVFVQMLAGHAVQRIERLVYQGNTDK